ncbi:MAG: BMP family lipoprotein [Actinomycetota bacterium]
MHPHIPKWFAALFVVLALVATACAEEEEPTDQGADGGQQVDFTACQVTDTGGVDDRSFNQTAFEGMKAAEEDLGLTEPQVLESQTPDDFEPNINQFLQQGCDLIITVGFLLGDATAAAAEANPDQQFAIVDFDFFDEEGNDVTYDNVRELTFDTDQAAFLAGYVAAAMSESGKVGTYGGINIPTVTIFMEGLAAGVDYYNEQKDTNVEVLGWNPDTQKGLFTGDFENQDKGRRITESLLGEGADIILPVAGPVGLGTAAAVQDAGEGSVIWVDTDGCVSVREFCDLFLTSIKKNMDVAVFDTIQAAVEGSFEGGLYVGTLENDGVGIAPFHEFEDEVPEELKSEIGQLRDGIIDGSISVEP